MHYFTNDELIEKQKIFILDILAKEENITRDRVVFSEIEYRNLNEFEPLTDLASVRKHVDEIMQEMIKGSPFPPILVYKPSLILMDGSHRFLASEALNYTKIPVLFYRILE